MPFSLPPLSGLCDRICLPWGLSWTYNPESWQGSPIVTLWVLEIRCKLGFAFLFVYITTMNHSTRLTDQTKTGNEYKSDQLQNQITVSYYITMATMLVINSRTGPYLTFFIWRGGFISWSRAHGHPAAFHCRGLVHSEAHREARGSSWELDRWVTHYHLLSYWNWKPSPMTPMCLYQVHVQLTHAQLT